MIGLKEGSNTLFHYQLFAAARNGDLDLFQRYALSIAIGEGTGVKEAVAEFRLTDGGGMLHVAAQAGTLNILKYLIEMLELHSNLEAKDVKGHTPLYHAIAKGHLDTSRYLLEKGANADASTDGNYTPLHCAAKTGCTKIITLLLSRGVRVDVLSKTGTALHRAAGGGHRDAVKVLLDHGANPNVACIEGEFAPLIKAVFVNSSECVELLLQAGADPNAVSYGNTPLVAAAKCGSVDVITRLLEAGADPDYKMNLGMTALEVAAAYNKYESVGVLFPVTSPILTCPEWSVAGLLRHIDSIANNMQRIVHEKEKFHHAKSKGRDAFQEGKYVKAANWFQKALMIYPEDPAVLSNMSACYARLGDGINALKYATECMDERPEWPKAYYRLGVALNILKRYIEAADAFIKGLELDPSNKELKDAYMKAIEDGLKSIKVEEDHAE